MFKLFIKGLLALLLMAVVVSCGQLGNQEDLIEQSIPITVPMISGNSPLGWINTTVTAPISFDQIYSVKLAIIDGQGIKHIVAEAFNQPLIQSGVTLDLMDIGNPTLPLCRIQFAQNQQLYVTVDVRGSQTVGQYYQTSPNVQAMQVYLIFVQKKTSVK